MKKLLAFLWLLPATVVVWALYILPLVLFRQIEFVSANDCVAIFKVRKVDTWYTRKWRDWGGWGGPCVILLRHDFDEWDVDQAERTFKHEKRHCQQQFWFGPLFYLAYPLATCWILMFDGGRHSYHDNPFERDARRFAGQKVDIPREDWMHGPDDRFPWL